MSRSRKYPVDTARDLGECLFDECLGVSACCGCPGEVPLEDCFGDVSLGGVVRSVAHLLLWVLVRVVL